MYNTQGFFVIKPLDCFRLFCFTKKVRWFGLLLLSIR